MADIHEISNIIAGFILLIVGIIILIYGIFNMIPREPIQETLLVWVIVLVFGFILVVLGSIVLRFKHK